VTLTPYKGYRATVNSGLGDEFATAGYRAHSMIHGEFEPTVAADRYSQAQLDAFSADGVTVEHDGDKVTLVIPLVLAFGNPDLLEAVGLGPILKSLAAEPQYRNDEQIDNSLRSVLFQIPKPGVPDPGVCGSPVIQPDCFTGVADLGAIDVVRGRDHGMPSYNDLRRAYGLAPKTSFAAVTGEATQSFPSGLGIDDPHSLDFVDLRDRNGHAVAPLADGAVAGVRRSTLAARLKALYGNVGKLDAFVGMLAEPHVAGSELGQLQRAMFKRQFEALRDGDRFFYLNDPELATIKRRYGICFRHTLADVIRMNTGAAVQDDVFTASG
jgi:peroxidase